VILYILTVIHSKLFSTNVFEIIQNCLITNVYYGNKYLGVNIIFKIIFLLINTNTTIQHFLLKLIISYFLYFVLQYTGQ
jgi:hypothetical protein